MTTDEWEKTTAQLDKQVPGVRRLLGKKLVGIRSSGKVGAGDVVLAFEDGSEFRVKVTAVVDKVTIAAEVHFRCTLCDDTGWRAALQPCHCAKSTVIPLQPQATRCPMCGGDATDAATPALPCLNCLSKLTWCPICEGDGLVRQGVTEAPCGTCRGTGYELPSQFLKVAAATRSKLTSHQRALGRGAGGKCAPNFSPECEEGEHDACSRAPCFCHCHKTSIPAKLPKWAQEF